jgi:hypothetical protein
MALLRLQNPSGYVVRRPLWLWVLPRKRTTGLVERNSSCGTRPLGRSHITTTFGKYWKADQQESQLNIFLGIAETRIGIAVKLSTEEHCIINLLQWDVRIIRKSNKWDRSVLCRNPNLLTPSQRSNPNDFFGPFLIETKASAK